MSAPVETAPAPSPHLPSLLGSLLAAVAAFDVCFWEARGLGLSEAVFFLGLVVLILIKRKNGKTRRTTWLILALIAGTALATLIESGTCNTLVWLILTITLAGDTFFTTVEEPWGRWLSQGVAMIRAPGRIVWLSGRLVDAALNDGMSGTGKLLRGAVLGLPAIFLVLIFGCLLSSGNAVFGVWTQRFFETLWNELNQYCDSVRIFLWILVAMAVLPLLSPVSVSPWWWSWTHRLPRFRERSQKGHAAVGSTLVLGALNALFLIANAADLLFLWSGANLPPGVTYSQFVHEGVNFLIATVLLSALVLAIIFQQSPGVVRSRGLRGLGLFWIAQNLFLILSVALRLKRYIETYEMTVSRISVVIFLALVATGYILLSIKIVRDRSLPWLIGGCALAIFATLYVTQFLDLAGWSAEYNVSRWARDHRQKFDVGYLDELGPAAWPALYRAYQIDPSVRLIDGQFEWDSEDKLRGWREFSLRRWSNRWALVPPKNN